MSKQKKKTHHSKPHGGGVSLPVQLARERAVRTALADEANQIAATQQTQRALWLAAITAAEVFHAGPERMQKLYFPAMQENVDELKKMAAENGEVYAWEKLRQRAESVTGISIEHFYDLNPAAMLRGEEMGGHPDDQSRAQQKPQV